MTIPDLRLNKPIIYERPLPKHHPDRDLPIIGSLPKNTTLKKFQSLKIYMEVWLNGKEASPNLDALANTEVKRNTDMMQNINQENIKERKDTVDVIKNIVNQNYHLFYLNIIQKKKKHTNLKKFKKFCKKKHIRKHKVAPEYYPKRKHHKKKLSLKKQIKKIA